MLKGDENPARSLVLPNKFVSGKKRSKNCNKNTDTYGLIYMTGDRNRHRGDGKTSNTHHAMTFRGQIPTNLTAGLISLVSNAPTIICPFYHLW